MGGRLGLREMLVVGLGDHAIVLSLSVVTLFLPFAFLVGVVGMRPSLAGWVILLGRIVDALTDPLMGRLSDQTVLSSGRRRPYMLWGAVPFALSFALLWLDPGLQNEAAQVAFYAVAYIGFSLCQTIVAVPYAALIPELVTDYHERNRMNAARSILGTLGTLLAGLVVQPALDQGLSHLQVCALLAIWIAVPWLLIYFSVEERPDFQRPSTSSLWQGLGTMAGNRSFRWLSGSYVAGRAAIDVAGSLFLVYVTYWLGRASAFPLLMAAVFLTTVLALPVWLLLARHLEKRTVLISGSLLWIAAQSVLYLARPEDSLAVLLVGFSVLGISYGVVDMMPWSMLGEVIDADELETGERRDGLYNGVFTFLRKVGGSAGVFATGYVLEAAGWSAQTAESAGGLQALRLVVTFAPIAFLLIAALCIVPYKLGRAEHRALLRQLEEQRDR